MREITVRIREIATDGLPDPDTTVGRVAFIFDGCVVSGWPAADGPSHWEADSDVGIPGKFDGVTHWLEFPEPVWKLERPTG